MSRQCTEIVGVIVLAAAALVAGCDKSLEVDAVSISDRTGKTIALDDDPRRVYLTEDKLTPPVEVAFRATGEAITTGRALDLVGFEMVPCESDICTIAKPASCSGESCNLIVRWSEPGFCAFQTHIEDDVAHGVGSSTYMFVGMNEGQWDQVAGEFDGGPIDEVRRRCHD